MRGQISLDMMLAIGFALVAVGTVLLVGEEIAGLQKASSIRQQLNSIGNGLAQTISMSNTLADGSSKFSIESEIPALRVIGETAPQKCGIEIAMAGSGIQGTSSTQGKITLSYMMFGATDPITAGKQFYDAGKIAVPASLKCGETVTITEA